MLKDLNKVRLKLDILYAEGKINWEAWQLFHILAKTVEDSPLVSKLISVIDDNPQKFCAMTHNKELMQELTRILQEDQDDADITEQAC